MPKSRTRITPVIISHDALMHVMSSRDWKAIFSSRTATMPRPPVANSGFGIEFAAGNSGARRSDICNAIAVADGRVGRNYWAGLFRLRSGHYLIAVGLRGGFGWSGCGCDIMRTEYASLDDAMAVDAWRRYPELRRLRRHVGRAG